MQGLAPGFQPLYSPCMFSDVDFLCAWEWFIFVSPTPHVTEAEDRIRKMNRDLEVRTYPFISLLYRRLIVLVRPYMYPFDNCPKGYSSHCIWHLMYETMWAWDCCGRIFGWAVCSLDLEHPWRLEEKWGLTDTSSSRPAETPQCLPQKSCHKLDIGTTFSRICISKLSAMPLSMNASC